MAIDKKEIKILFFVGGTKVFGREKGMLGTMVALKERGFSIMNISNGWNDGLFNALLKENNIPYEEIKIGKISKVLSWKYLGWTLNALINLLTGLLKARRVIKEFKPDIFFFDSPYLFFFLSLFLGPAPNIIIGYHEFPTLNFFLRSALSGKYSKKIQHYGISIFIVSNLKKLNIPASNISLAYYSNQIETKLNQNKAINQNNIIFGFAGQIAPRKGAHLVIEALALAAKGNRASLWIAGSGEEEYLNLLKKRAVDLGIVAQIEWKGYYTEMSLFYNAIDVCIVPSIFEEPFGLIPLEAGMHGAPSIVSNRGGLVEIVEDNKTGFIVPYDDASAIADKINFFVNNPELIPKMGMDARKLCTVKFSKEKHVEAIEKIINKLM